MLKRLLAVVMAVALAMPVTGLAAGNEKLEYKTLVNDDFSGYGDDTTLAGGGKWDFAKSAGKYGRLTVRKEENNPVLAGEMGNGSSAVMSFGKKAFNLTGNADLSFRIKPVSGERLDFSLEADAFIRRALIRFSGGEVTALDGRVLGSYLPNRWNDVRIDFSGDSAIFSLNGHKTPVNVPKDVRMLSNLYFVLRSHGLAATVLWDDISISHYASEKPAEPEYIARDTGLEKINSVMAGKMAFAADCFIGYDGNRFSEFAQGDYSVTSYLEGGSLMIPAGWLAEKLQTAFPDSALSGKGGISYISLEKVAELMHKYTYYDSVYKYWVFGTATDPFGADAALAKRDFDRRLKYRRPSAAQLIESIQDRVQSGAFSGIADTGTENGSRNTADTTEANASPQVASHPRIIATKSDFNRVKNLIGSNVEAKQLFDTLTKNTDKFINTKYVWNSGDFDKMIDLTLLYNVTGDVKYAEGAWRILEYAANLEDWSLGNTVTTGNIVLLLSLGYDGFYDYLTENQKQIIKNAVFEKALVFADAVYLKQPSGKMTNWWPHTNNNWNFVCNGSFAVAALTFTEENEAMCSRILTSAIEGMEYAMDAFGQNGGWAEGPMYWKYGVQFLYHFIEALESATGDTYGYVTNAVAKSPLFPMYVSSEQGAFNFGDATQNVSNFTELMYSGYASKNGEYMRTRLDMIKKFNFPPKAEDILYFNPDITPEKVALPNDKYFDTVETAAFRTSWKDSDEVFLGIRGGLNNVNHGDLDKGAFVMDALGERFFCDLGSDNYSLPSYFGTTVGAGRWKYYRKRAEGANTLVINPTEQEDQYALGFAPITKFVSAPGGGYAVMDLTPVYPGTKQVRRGVMLYDDRTKVLVQDEIRAAKPSKVYWFAHTLADIEVAKDGKSAVLNINGKKVQADLLTPQNASFSVMDAKPLPSSPQVKNGDNGKMKKLTVEMDNVTQTRIAVSLIPLPDGKAVEKPAQVVPLDRWYISGEENPDFGLQGITVDGTDVDGFDPNRRCYTYGVYTHENEMPEVAVKEDPDKGYTFKVEQASSGSEPAVISVMGSDGKIKRNYYVFFKRLGLPVANVEASHEPQAENNKENVLDGSLLTRWSAQGDNEWIMLELEKAAVINQVSIAWYDGQERKTGFDIEVSGDKQEWKKVYSGTSSGSSSIAEGYEFDPVEAKFVRINCHGTNVNKWNSILTIDIY